MPGLETRRAVAATKERNPIRLVDGNGTAASSLLWDGVMATLLAGLGLFSNIALPENSTYIPTTGKISSLWRKFR
jgi:hypothetical protein